jgi:Flp pilus assembly protein protease CpaA
LVELAVALLWAFMAWRYGFSLEALKGALFGTLLIGIALTDAREYIIPNEFTWGGLALGLVLAAAAGLDSMIAAAIGAVVGFGLLWLVGAVGTWAFKEEAMGGGDIKMMAMVGSFIGWQGVLLTIFLGALAGTLIFLPSPCSVRSAGALRRLPRDRRGGHLRRRAGLDRLVSAVSGSRMMRAAVAALVLALVCCRGAAPQKPQDGDIARLVDSLRRWWNARPGSPSRAPPDRRSRARRRCTDFLLEKLQQEFPAERQEGSSGLQAARAGSRFGESQGPAARSLQRTGGWLLRSGHQHPLRGARAPSPPCSAWCWRTSWSTRCSTSTCRSIRS